MLSHRNYSALPSGLTILCNTSVTGRKELLGMVTDLMKQEEQRQQIADTTCIHIGITEDASGKL